jgi:hypothetical protein
LSPDSFEQGPSYIYLCPEIENIKGIRAAAAQETVRGQEERRSGRYVASFFLILLHIILPAHNMAMSGEMWRGARDLFDKKGVELKICAFL